MLLDDEAANQQVFADILSDFGYQVIPFSDSQAAYDHFVQSPDAIDLVLTDYAMPQMDGKNLCHALKAVRSDLKVVLMTGFGNWIEQQDWQDWGFSSILPKPAKMEDLNRIVRETLDRKSP